MIVKLSFFKCINYCDRIEASRHMAAMDVYLNIGERKKERDNTDGWSKVKKIASVAFTPPSPASTICQGEPLQVVQPTN